MKNLKKWILFFIAVFLILLLGKIYFTPKNTQQTSSDIPLAEDSANAQDSPNIEQTPKELFADNYAKAEQLMNTMTLDEKVSQMFYAYYPENGVTSAETAGGYLLFGYHFKNETPASLSAKLAKTQANSKIKCIFGVDEEGGSVVRASLYSAFRDTKFQSPQELYAAGGMEKILSDSTEKSVFLKKLGLNMNLVPVADVPTDSNAFIYARSFGQNVAETSQYVKQLIAQMNADSMLSSMKHFPGYGDNLDTHTGIAIDSRPYAAFEEADFLPFTAGIQENAPTILVSHNVVTSMDADLPASLSPHVHQILRENLNFSGLILTDDLAMDAVKEYADNGKAAVQAVLAGNDMIITSDFKTQKQEVLTAAKSGEIPTETIDAAVRRILACKYAYGILP